MRVDDLEIECEDLTAFWNVDVDVDVEDGGRLKVEGEALQGSKAPRQPEWT